MSKKVRLHPYFLKLFQKGVQNVQKLMLGGGQGYFGQCPKLSRFYTGMTFLRKLGGCRAVGPLQDVEESAQ